MLRSALQKLALLTIALGGSLVVAELVLAMAAPQIHRQPDVWQYDADLGWAHRPDATGRLVQPEFDVLVRTDAHGLRGAGQRLEKEPGTERVLVFGDSFAEGWGVEEAETVSARLAARRSEALGRPVEGLTFGVAGYGIDQALLAFHRDGRRFHPDLVVLLVFANDLWDTTNPHGLGGRGHDTPKPLFAIGPDDRLVLTGVPVPRTTNWDAPTASIGEFRKWLAERSHLAALVARISRGGLSPAQTRRYYDRIYGDPGSGSNRPTWRVVESVLLAFDQLVRDAGARFIVVWIPERLEIEDDAWEAASAAADLPADLDRERPGRTLGVVTSRLGIPYLNLATPLKRHRGNGERLYFREGHWNAGGHDAAAEALQTFLQQDAPVPLRR